MAGVRFELPARYRTFRKIAPHLTEYDANGLPPAYLPLGDDDITNEEPCDS